MARCVKSILPNPHRVYPTTMIFDFIRRKSLVCIRTLIQNGVDIEAKDSNGHTPLLFACYDGAEEIVSFLIKNGANAESKCPSDEYTVFHFAAAYGWTEILHLLVFLNKGFDLNVRDINGETPMHHASKSGHTEIVKYLVEQGADVNIKDYDEETPLHASSNAGHLDTVKYLLEKGANMNVTCSSGYTPLLCAASYSQKDVVDLLLSSGAEVNGLCGRKFTLLHHIANRGWLDTAQFLINKGCDLDATNAEGRTSLTLACLSRHFETAQVLLHAGANCNIVDKHDNSPLSFSARYGPPHSKFIKLLILHGAYLKPIDYYAIVESPSLEVLQDVKLCSQEIINRFNNRDLCELYKLPVSENLPRIEKIKIANGGEVAQAIERNVGIEIQTKGHCNILKVSPMTLSVFSVKCILKYYMEKTPKLKSGLKRSAALDSLNNDQHCSKSIRSC